MGCHAEKGVSGLALSLYPPPPAHEEFDIGLCREGPVTDWWKPLPSKAGADSILFPCYLSYPSSGRRVQRACGTGPVHETHLSREQVRQGRGPWQLSLSSKDFVKEITTGLCVSVVLWPGTMFREVPSRSGDFG